MRQVVDALMLFLPSALPIGLAAFIAGAAIFVFIRGVRGFDKQEGPPGYIWQALLFAAIIDGLILAGLGVGKFLELFTDGAGAITGIVVTLFGGWLGYKAAALKINNPKHGSTDVTAEPPK